MPHEKIGVGPPDSDIIRRGLRRLEILAFGLVDSPEHLVALGQGELPLRFAESSCRAVERVFGSPPFAAAQLVGEEREPGVGTLGCQFDGPCEHLAGPFALARPIEQLAQPEQFIGVFRVGLHALLGERHGLFKLAGLQLQLGRHPFEPGESARAQGVQRGTGLFGAVGRVEKANELANDFGIRGIELQGPLQPVDGGVDVPLEALHFGKVPLNEVPAGPLILRFDQQVAGLVEEPTIVVREVEPAVLRFLLPLGRPHFQDLDAGIRDECPGVRGTGHGTDVGGSGPGLLDVCLGHRQFEQRRSRLEIIGLQCRRLAQELAGLRPGSAGELNRRQRCQHFRRVVTTEGLGPRDDRRERLGSLVAGIRGRDLGLDEHQPAAVGLVGRHPLDHRPRSLGPL